MANEYQVTAFAYEVLTPGVPKAQITTFGLEVLTPGVPKAQITGLAMEVLRSVASGSADQRRRSSATAML